MDSEGRNFFLTYFCDFIYQIKVLEILFSPRSYNLMSENIIDWENKFTNELLYMSLISPGYSDTIEKSRDYNNHYACFLSTPMGVDYVVIGFDMEVQPLVTHNAA